MTSAPTLPAVTLPRRAEFDRVTTWLCALGGALGALAGLTSTAFPPFAAWLAVAAMMFVSPRDEQGGPAVTWTSRLGVALLTGTLVVMLPGHLAVVLSCFAGAGAMLAGPDATAKSRTVAAASAALSMALFFAASNLAMRWWPAALHTWWPAVQAVLAAVFLGLSRLPLELRWHRSRLAATLAQAGDQRLWRVPRALERVEQALRRLPRQHARAALQAHAGRLAAEALRLSGQLQSLEGQLSGVDRAAIEREHAELSKQATSAPDAQTRVRLQRAAGQVSDLLEQLDGLQVRRGRLEAQLQVQVTSLERAALALECTPTTGPEVAALAARLVDAPGADAPMPEPVTSAAR